MSGGPGQRGRSPILPEGHWAPTAGRSNAALTLTVGVSYPAYVADMDMAWGCKPHSGWAVAVLVGGSATAPRVLDRRRVQLCPDDLPRMAYHAAQGLPRAKAAALVANVDAAVAAMTAAVVRELADVASGHGHLVALALLGNPRPLPDLDAALANHSRLHGAEGELYRGALDDAAAAHGLAVYPVPPKGTIVEAAHGLGTTADALGARLTGLRAELGAPWQADHKDATAAALMALHLLKR